MSYNYDLQYAHFDPTTGVHTEMCLDTFARYGFFERYRMLKNGNDAYMSRGGLWLGKHKYNGIELLDYDGVCELPEAVAFLLMFAGVYVDPDFTDY